MSRSTVFVLGAGFAAPFGIPTMKPFFQSFRDCAIRKYPELQGTLRKHLERLEDGSDIEALLSSLGSAEGLRNSMPPGSALSDELDAWEEESTALKGHLVSYIIERCERFDEGTAVKRVRPLLKGLVENEATGTICFPTTNYDRIIEYVSNTVGLKLSDGFGGHGEAVTAPWTGEFEQRLQLYKLHGSVTYYGDRQAQGSGRYFRLDRGYPLPGLDFRLTRGGNALEPLMVLPTLEKETLDDPYGQLNHRFAEMVAKSRVVVAIGTSLRDKDLVSALNYSARRSVILLVDAEPSIAQSRIQDLRCITIKADSSDFLIVSTKRLVKLLDACAGEDEDSVVIQRVETFAREEKRKIAQWVTTSSDQRDALRVIQTEGTDSKKMNALQVLWGLGDADVVEAVSKMCRIDQSSPIIRKAAAGCLGLSGSHKAAEALREYTINDPLPDVRLEGYLALRETGK